MSFTLTPRIGLFVLLNSLSIAILITIFSKIPAFPEMIWISALFFILVIIVLLGLAKWYFRRVTPTTSSGMLLGACTVVGSIIMDILLSSIGRLFFGSIFTSMIPLHVLPHHPEHAIMSLILLVIMFGTLTLAGFEFDGIDTH